MARVGIPFGRTFSPGRSRAAGLQALVNMYGEPVEGEGRTDFVCYGTPGRRLFATIGNGMVRGQVSAGDVHYVVIGETLYAVNAGGGSNALGTIEGTQPVDMAYNGAQLDIVGEVKSYVLDVPTLALSEHSGGGFEQAASCTSIASYSIMAVANTGRFRWRLINDTTWSALDFATAEAESDNLVAVRAVANDVALLGARTVEWWGPTGNPGANAFAKTATAAANIGCASRDTAIVVDSGLTWVGRDGSAGGISVYRAEGYAPRKISPPEVDTLLEQVSSLSALSAFSYQQRGHLFYVLVLPGEWALAWDISTNLWSYRASGLWPISADPLGGWDARTMAINAGRQIVGGQDGNLYELMADTYTDGAQGLVRQATTAQLSHNGRRAYMSRLELDIEAGVGLVTGQGSDPQVMAVWSDDGGRTWSNPRQASLGQIGQHRVRAVWHACGSYRDRMIRFRVTDPVKAVFLAAYADVKVGAT
jgi:hypothetical protein